MFLIVWVNKASSRENNWIDGEEILGRWQGDVNFTTIIFRISNSLLAKYSAVFTTDNFHKAIIPSQTVILLLKARNQNPSGQNVRNPFRLKKNLYSRTLKAFHALDVGHAASRADGTAKTTSRITCGFPLWA